MKKIIVVVVAVFVVFLLILFFGIKNTYKKEKMVEDMGSEKEVETKDKIGLSLITTYDNYKFNPELKTGWGFSCLIKIEDKNILFDTGGDHLKLLYNMEKLKIDPKKIDMVVLSHIHWDHVGGLAGILETNPNVDVYLPKSFPPKFKEEIKSYGARVVEVDNATKIFDGVYTTGELGTWIKWIKEQSLIVKTEKGLVVVTGCAHPGVVNIVKSAKKLINDKVYLVIGGFHLLAATDLSLRKIIKNFRELGVKKVAPCHCSGNRTRKLFEEEYKKDFIENGVGKIVKI